MSNITCKNLYAANRVGRAPYGNLTALTVALALNASGVIAASDSTSAVAAGDVVRVGVIPAGTTLLSAQAVITDAFRATTTADIGFAYVDGVDDADVPQVADYFLADLAADAVGRTESRATVPVTLPKDAYLIVTPAVVAQNGSARLDVHVFGICNGSN